MAISLDCPLCAASVADGADSLVPGRCPNCDARYEGDGDHPVAGAAAAASAFGVDGLDAEPLAKALFAIDPGDPLGSTVGIASDSRDGFYRWWVFVRDDAEAPESILRGLLTDS